MSNSNEHNLEKAVAHARRAAARLRTIKLDKKNLLSDFQSKTVHAHIKHLDDIRSSLNEIREDLTGNLDTVTVSK